MIKYGVVKQEIIEKHRSLYKSIVSVFCPILNETVYFTSEGFNHLLYHSHNRPRSFSEKFLKLSNLKFAPDVISGCTIISETRKFTRTIKGKVKDGVRYELIHEVMVGAKVRVVVEKIGSGHHRFMSVMPHDKKSKRLLTAKKHP